MKAIQSIQGTVAPLMLEDIDTDVIIPAQHLTQTTQSGYGQHAFARLREDPDFVLSQPQYQGAKVLVTGDNFGCGSSREHAVWALQQMGFAAIVAPSFADIFSNNAKKNGLVLITLDGPVCHALAAQASQQKTTADIDIAEGTVEWGTEKHKVELDPFFRHCLLKGQDELAYLMSHRSAIVEHKTQHIHFIQNGART